MFVIVQMLQLSGAVIVLHPSLKLAPGLAERREAAPRTQYSCASLALAPAPSTMQSELFAHVSRI